MVEGILFEQVEDSRQDWKVKHSISEILMVVMCGVSAGERSIYGIREFAPVNINELIKNLFATFQDEFSAAKISILPQLDNELPVIQADERFLRQALMNILTNAKAAMMPAGGELGITTRFDQERVYIIITDTGKGIPPDILHKIFEPYFTTKPDGSGLGLTMTYKVMKEHGGDIQVHSDIGKGTRFTLILPITRSEKPLLLEARTAHGGGAH